MLMSSFVSEQVEKRILITEWLDGLGLIMVDTLAAWWEILITILSEGCFTLIPASKEMKCFSTVY